MNSGAIWNQVPASLAGVIESVYHTNTYGERTTHDKLFLASYYEMTARLWSSDKWTALAPEIVVGGTERTTAGPFHYFDANHLNVSGADAPQASMVKHRNGAVSDWWLRNIDPNNSGGWGQVASTGDVHNGRGTSTELVGVVPCFAL